MVGNVKIQGGIGMIYLNAGKFYLGTCTKLTNIAKDKSGKTQLVTEEVPVSDSLEIGVADWNAHLSKHRKPLRFVIAFIEWDSHEESTEVKSVGTRMVDYIDASGNDWKEFKALCKAGSALIEGAHAADKEDA
jgi:hypothetical protein